MLLIDGVRYELWTPSSEDEFERVVKEHVQDIFGEQSIYLDTKTKLKSVAGIGSIPDGFVIVLGDLPHWHIVEVELSTHSLDEHILPQFRKFIAGIKNPDTQRGIVTSIYNEINKDGPPKLKLKEAIGQTDIHKFLTDLISRPPLLTVIIEQEKEDLRETVNSFPFPEIKKFVEVFQTFVREGTVMHAHFFEPLLALPKSIKVKYEIAEYKVGKKVRPYHKLMFEKRDRDFLPGYKQDFTLITDIGETKARVTSARKGTSLDEPEAGRYITGSLGEWAKKNGLRGGETFLLEQVEPKIRYRLAKMV